MRGVAGQPHLHLVHDVAERELGIGVGPAHRAAGAEVAERVLAAERHEAGAQHEPEPELDVEPHQHDVRARRQLRRRLLELRVGQDADAVDLTDARRVQARDRTRVGDTVRGRDLRGAHRTLVPHVARQRAARRRQRTSEERLGPHDLRDRALGSPRRTRSCRSASRRCRRPNRPASRRAAPRLRAGRSTRRDRAGAATSSRKYAPTLRPEIRRITSPTNQPYVVAW